MISDVFTKGLHTVERLIEVTDAPNMEEQFWQ
jgi:hypothetical protein